MNNFIEKAEKEFEEKWTEFEEKEGGEYGISAEFMCEIKRFITEKLNQLAEEMKIEFHKAIKSQNLDELNKLLPNIEGGYYEKDYEKNKDCCNREYPISYDFDARCQSCGFLISSHNHPITPIKERL